MATVQYSGLVAGMSGKLSGGVHARNKGGAYIRTAVTPINRATAAQQGQRAIVSTIAKAWPNHLNDAQRSAWNTYGQQAGAIGSFGAGIILSGIAAFHAVNRAVLAAGGTLITDAPISKQIDAVLSGTLTANHTGPILTFDFTPTPYAGTQGLYVFATPALSAGISNASTALRLLGFFPTAATPIDLMTLWTTSFGPFPTSAGQRIAITAQGLDLATGAIAAAFGASTLVI